LFSAYLGKLPACILLTIFLLPRVSAQELSTNPEKLVIPDRTPIKLRLEKNISSAHAHVGDGLDFVVVRDVNLDGFTVIHAGSTAQGSITGVKHKRWLGIGGRVSLKLNSVELVNGDRVGVRASKEVKGGSRTKLMVAGMIVTSLVFLPATPVFLLTRGHDSTVVKGTEITAQTDGATPVRLAGLPRSRESASGLDEMMDYLPARIFDGEGREGDMLNLVFVARQEDLQETFERAGWVKTDERKSAVVWHLMRHGTSDTQLPMSNFYLFGRQQDYSYALPDPGAIVSRRHHLRIWKTDYTLDGTPIWAGAATHDVAIEIAKRGHLLNHRIDPEVDAERDFIGANLTDTSAVSRREYLHCVDPVFQAQTASGERYHSDSRILLLDLHPITATKTDVGGQSSSSMRATSQSIGSPGNSFQSTTPR
jgi:hypothetical protein